MKTILQKHTSKFVVNLLNGLGITACVALTSCGDQDKSKQTENQVENLKNGLKNVEFYKNLADDEDSLKAIADWLNNKNYGSDHILTENELREIFQYDSSKLNEVAEKLGVELTVFEEEPDDEKKKEINEWLNKLNGLENAKFNELGGDLKEKVAQKFIANGININEVTVIKEMLAGFIEEVKDEKKQNEISIKVGGEGKVTITKVADSTPTDFVFGTFDVFEKFVGDLKGKEITETEVSLSFGFEGKMVKICGHKIGFDVTGCFEKFLNCFEILTKIEALKLQVSGLSLKIEKSKLSLNEVDCSSDDYFKKVGFWTLVKDYAAFFGITNDKKFEIVKDGSEDSAVVKIGDFKSSLEWSKVVQEDGKTFVEDSGWENIFKIKDKIPASTTKKDVTVKFEKGKCICSEIEKYKSGVELNSLEALKKLVEDLKDKKVTIAESKDFSLAFDGKNVKVCEHTEGFEVMKNTDFETLLQYVTALKGEGKAIGKDFTIKIAVATNDIQLGGKKIDQTFMKTENFWGAVKAHKELFDKLPIEVVKDNTQESKKGNIGTTVIDVKMFNEGKITEEWKSVFQEKTEKK